MIYSMKNILRGIIITILVCLVSPLPSYASGQGLFFTPEEIGLWHARAQQGPFNNANDAWPGSPRDWQRILDNADDFLNNPELYPPLTNAKDPFNATISRIGFAARDAAFVYLITPESDPNRAAYGNAVRNWLLATVRDQTNDITQLPPVYATLPDGTVNYFDAYSAHGMGVARLTMIYDFAKDSFSTQERDEVEIWLQNAANYFEKYVHSGGLDNGLDGCSDDIDINCGTAGLMANFPNRKSDDYTVRSLDAWRCEAYPANCETDSGAWHQLNAITTEELQPDGTFTCDTTNLTTPLTEIYAYVRADGTPVNRLSVLSQWYNNRRSDTVLAFGLIGVLLNNDYLKGEAKRYVKEWLRYGVWPDGSQGEYARNGNYCTEQAGVIYGSHNAQAAALLAEALARRGDLELYQYSSVWGLYGSGVSETQGIIPPGSPTKTIWDTLKTHLQLADENLQWYQHEAWKTQQEPRPQTHLDGIVEIGQFGPLHTYHESSYLPANRYYRSTLMRDVILHSPEEAGHPPFPGTDGLTIDNGFESWSGATSLFPGLLFMYADSVADLGIAMIDSPDPALLGQTVNYTITVTNYGLYPATNVTASGTLPSCNLGIILSGTSLSCTRSVTANSVGILSQSMSVTAAEVDRKTVNNTANITTTVLAPDLVPTAMSASKSGSKVTVSDTVKNQGNSNAGSFTVSYYLSTNTTYDSGDLPLVSSSGGSTPCTRNVSSLGIGASSSVSSKTCYKPAKVVTKTKYYVLVVDDSTNNQVIELNEMNNTGASAGQLSW